MSDFVTEFKSLKRPRDGRLVFGVCRGLADRFGTEVLAIRIGVVLAAAVIDYIPLAYIVGVLFIPSVAKTALPVKRHGRFRQLALFALLAGVSDAVIDDSLPSSKAFAVLLVLVGIAMMNMRNRSLRQRTLHEPSGAAGDQSVGGWVSPSAPQTNNLPPRWGLAGETVNPHVWVPGDATPSGPRSKWHSQFGNLAIVTLVAVLGIGIWTNTSNKSPLRQAALKERLDDGPVVISTVAELGELRATNLGDGAFVIDMSTFDLAKVDQQGRGLDVTMGNGRLEVLVRPGTKVTGSVVAARRDGVVAVHTPGKQLVGPNKFSETIGSTTRSAAPKAQAGQTLSVSVKISHGLVCVRSPEDSTCA